MVFAINVNIAWTQERYKKNLLFYGAKFFLSLLDGSLFLQLKIGQSKSFEKASQSSKMVGVFRNTKEILVYKQCSLNAAQFKLALQIYQTCDIILSVNYMSSRIK